MNPMVRHRLDDGDPLWESVSSLGILTEGDQAQAVLFRDQQQRLALEVPSYNPFFIDFVKPSEQRKFRTFGRGQMFAKALGVGKGTESAVDLTAGLGQDSMFMAALGLSVVALEREPFVYLLLKDALDRAGEAGGYIAEVTGRIQLKLIEAEGFLTGEPPKADVYYLDPMFPDKKKSALSQKGMQILQKLVDNPPAEPLIEVALNAGARRVLLKRPVKAPVLGKPAHQYRGERVRYDLYISSSG
ncbi:MAG: SAM-dependent methyltransferase [Bdellovibrionaceae bacterium]|nr:SAM-dependent methyltransferase [Pseudobdellovibrionaceae bacterium]